MSRDLISPKEIKIISYQHKQADLKKDPEAPQASQPELPVT